MQRFPQGLFKPGDLPLAGLMLSCLEVHNEDELAAALADGWFEDPNEADAFGKAEAAKAAALVGQAGGTSDTTEPPTRAELEQKATELGVKFDGRVSDKTLAERIAAALKG